MNLWQSKLWEAFQKDIGRSVFRIDNMLILEKTLPGHKKYFEIQRATPNAETWDKLMVQMREQQVIFCRIAPDTNSPPLVSGIKTLTSPDAHFPEYTRIIDLLPPENDIFASFTQTGRRHIRTAEKNQLTVTTSADVETFAALAKVTAKRDGFSSHSSHYFHTLLTFFGDQAYLLVVKNTNQWLAAGIFIACGDTAIYYYGASANEFRELNAATLLQWEAMKLAKVKGCRFFDLLGISPDDDSGHRLAGVSQFKKKFGGYILKYYPETDVVLNPSWYAAYQIAKKIRSFFS